mmetsp:Transcript_121139/g.377163  ORF Transcript_121139/g.377163 Transcript_121139/m.377163 type:complete len:109 (-) Transcript_121139:25-351(-)
MGGHVAALRTHPLLLESHLGYLRWTAGGCRAQWDLRHEKYLDSTCLEIAADPAENMSAHSKSCVQFGKGLVLGARAASSSCPKFAKLLRFHTPESWDEQISWRTTWTV